MSVKHYPEYAYVGSKALQESLPKISRRTHIVSAEAVVQWIRDTEQTLDRDRRITATFIIDTNIQLWIADRRSEHVLCAFGENVLSAGEMTFIVTPKLVEVTEVTNQSTGYCPEPESWGAVETALNEARLKHPSDFTTAYQFRRCDSCGATNLIKDDWFECAVCQSPLSPTWNYDPPIQ